MIEVKVKLYATLRQYVPNMGIGEAVSFRIEENSTIRDLMDEIGIPKNEFKQAFVDCLSRDADYVLKDRDTVAIFPPVAGG